MSITFDDADGDADLSPVLTQLHEHAAGLRCLHLQLDRSWEGDLAWKALGGMVNLTMLELAFGTRVSAWAETWTGTMNGDIMLQHVIGPVFLGIWWRLVRFDLLRTRAATALTGRAGSSMLALVDCCWLRPVCRWNSLAHYWIYNHCQA
jgi:hypothetical protein